MLVALQPVVHTVHPVMHEVGMVSAHLGLDAVYMVGVMELHVLGMAVMVGVVGVVVVVVVPVQHLFEMHGTHLEALL